MDIDPVTLVLHINESFGAGVYPGDDKIVRDNTGSDLESTRIRETLRGYHWRDVAFDVLERLRFALPFLSTEGYRFYLPAYMVMPVIDFERAGVIADEVVRSLTPPRPSDVDRMRDVAAQHPEGQPLGAGEWDEILDMASNAYASGGPAEATFLERVSGFTTAQRKVIREFLQFMQEAHGDDFPGGEPGQALRRYWSSSPGSGTG